MEHTRKSTSTMTEHEREMAAKLERIITDPEGYYATARKAAYRDELRRALMPWRKSHPRSA
ncbi:hypothetical protein [Brachybacterium tyrofermentans]|uniref:hypothetical protein n=1 Tax=Brachybacterium tyrofermentans TaxID=47848 RepID=UPI001865B619|nr:hypothetical protein [Brachybacterium tyrofermentans]